MDTIEPLRFVFAFLFVLGLIGVMALCLKRYGRLQKFFAKPFFAAPEIGGRLEVLETRWLDAKRRLVLVRRDNVEHLLLLGDDRELVIEKVVKNDER